MEIDRRNTYYQRVAAIIAADPLDWYTRAEKGRRYQAWLGPHRHKTPAAVAWQGEPPCNVVAFQPRMKA